MADSSYRRRRNQPTLLDIAPDIADAIDALDADQRYRLARCLTREANTRAELAAARWRPAAKVARLLDHADLPTLRLAIDWAAQ